MLTIIDLNPVELIYYPSMTSINKFCGSYNDELSMEMCLPSETEVELFNMKKKIDESRILTKHVSWEFKCKFVGRKCYSKQKLHNHKCQCELKNLREHHVSKKNYVWNPVVCACENGKYLGSTIGDSIIMCEKIIEETRTISTNFNEKNVSFKMESFYIIYSGLFINYHITINSY